MAANKDNKKEVVACIRKVWKTGVNQKVVGIPNDVPIEAGEMVLIMKINEAILTLPSNTESYLRVYLDKQLK